MKRSTSALTTLLAKIVDNRGKSVPTVPSGFPLIATNCIKHESLFPVFENIRFVDDDVKKSWFRSHPEANDIIFVNKGTPGRVCLVPHPVSFCIAQDMVAFRCDKNEIDYQYLFAALRSTFVQEKIRNFHVGLAIPHFKKGDLNNILIPRMGTRAEELAIGELYVGISQRIECNSAICAELEAVAQAIYDYWFTQFDFPDAAGKPYRKSGGKMVWCNSLKREVPERWTGNNISSVAQILGGATPRKTRADFWGGEIPFFTPTDATGDVFQLHSEDSITQVGLESCSSELFSKGTVFVTARGSVGKTTIAGRPMAMNQSCYALVPKVAANYPYVFLLAKTLVDHLKVKASGSTFSSIVTNDIEWTQLVSPEPHVIAAFCELVTPMFRRIELTLKESHELTQLRDWLLPLLMSGQVRVA